MNMCTILNYTQKNRTELRKLEAEFRDKRYEIEDAILADLTKETSEQP